MAEEPQPFVTYHKDGSLWAKGQVIGDVPTGYWEWFRVSGTISRSGYFQDGIQVGPWTTYDKDGHIYKVTEMKADRSNAPRAQVDLAKDPS